MSVSQWIRDFMGIGSNAPIRPQVETPDALRPVLKKLVKKATARRGGGKK